MTNLFKKYADKLSARTRDRASGRRRAAGRDGPSPSTGSEATPSETSGTANPQSRAVSQRTSQSHEVSPSPNPPRISSDILPNQTGNETTSNELSGTKASGPGSAQIRNGDATNIAASEVQTTAVNRGAADTNQHKPSLPDPSPERTTSRENGRDIESEHILAATNVSPGIMRSQTQLSVVPEPKKSLLSKELYAAPSEDEEHQKVSQDEEDQKVTVEISHGPHNSPKTKSILSEVYEDEKLQEIFPQKIECLLTVTFNERRIPGCPRHLEDFAWYQKESYTEIRGAIQNITQSFNLHEKQEEPYLRYASCFVEGVRNKSGPGPEEDTLIVHEEALPDTAIQAICGFIHDYPFEPFKLQIYYDFSSIEISLKTEGPWPRSQTPFHLMIYEKYNDKMDSGRKTIYNTNYLSRADRNVLITPLIVARIIEDGIESDPKLTKSEKEELERVINLRTASVLQAVCAYAFIPMRFLYHFLCEEPHEQQRCSDDFQSLQVDKPNECENKLCKKYYDKMIRNIYLFFPDTIRRNPTHFKKNKHMLIPVRYKGGVKKMLGDGGFGEVYEVEIDPPHQLISPDVTKTYALKKFKKGEKDFNRELQMLLHLAIYLPHEHILTHITSWEQNDEYYILYEKAHGNLRRYMEEYSDKCGDLSQKRILWFFCQLRGLTDAVRRIHFFHENRHVNSQTGEVQTSEVTKTGVVGFHHDIKPENILTFDNPKELPIFKLSDFGSGKFSIVKAKNVSAEIGTRDRATVTYSGPERNLDFTVDKKKVGMSRPYDMWSLGCVFLELLLWFLKIEKPDGMEKFDDMRLNRRYHLHVAQDIDYFWQHDRDGYYELNGAVTFVLDRLETKYCQDMQLFQELISLIRQLLIIKPSDRLKALDLFNGLDAIVVKAKIDLQNVRPSYSEIFKSNESSEEIPRVEEQNRGTGLLSVRDLVDKDDISQVDYTPNLSDVDVQPSEASRELMGRDAVTSFGGIGQHVMDSGIPMGTLATPSDHHEHNQNTTHAAQVAQQIRNLEAEFP